MNPFVWGPTLVGSSEVQYAGKPVIGEGAFSKVYRMNVRGQTVAVKVLNKPYEEGQQKAFLRELEVLRSVNHPNVVMFMGAVVDNAQNLIAELTLVYNKTRQQTITAEILDIVGGSMNA